MTRYFLGFGDEQDRSLAVLGQELQGLLGRVIQTPGEAIRVPWSELPEAALRSPRDTWDYPSPLIGWAGSEQATLLMTSERERRRFESWEREVLLTAGMPGEWSQVTARQLSEAWEVVGSAMSPRDLPSFTRRIAAKPRRRRRAFVRLRQWWGSLREELRDEADDAVTADGALTFGGFASSLCNKVFAYTHFDENAASTIAGAVIASPTCLKAVRHLPVLGHERWYSAIHEGDPRSQAIAQWAECLSAVVTTWP